MGAVEELGLCLGHIHIYKVAIQEKVPVIIVSILDFILSSLFAFCQVDCE